MGFYPVNPGGRVRHRRAAHGQGAIDLGGQRTFSIEAQDLSPITSTSGRDAQRQTGSTAAGEPCRHCRRRTIRFTMGAEPNTAWASSPDAARRR